MAQQSIPVTPGQVATVNVALATGATVYNGDSTNAVWVSNDPGVGPGAGMRIGPKGSVTWSSTGPCYARVDTGVTSQVTLTVSTDVSNLVNPVDIGVAVATQLLAKGVPNVFQGAIVAAGASLPLISGKTYGFMGLNVSQYASLTITINTPVEAQVSATFNTADGLYNLGSFDFPITNTGGAISFVMPVTGPTLSLVVAAISNATMNAYTIYGSNRAVETPRILNGYGRMPNYGLGKNYGFGERVDNPLPFISNGKPAYLRLVVTGAGKGKWGYLAFNGSDAVGQYDIIDTTLGKAGYDGSETEVYVNLPPGKLTLYYFSLVAANYTVVYGLTQEF